MCYVCYVDKIRLPRMTFVAKKLFTFETFKRGKSHKLLQICDFEMFQDKMTFNVYVFLISIISIMIKSTFLRCNMLK